MMEKRPFKMGVTFGELKGQRDISTGVEHPQYAVNLANQIIHENYSPDVSLFLVDEGQQRNRKTRRRL
jgi:hypothetical protein